MKRKPRGKWMLETYVTGIEYNFVEHVGRLYMDRACCCDMEACIDYIRNIDPRVERIRTFARYEEDTFYCRASDGTWKAHKVRPGRLK
jgi:hypothetical protein